MPGFHLVGPHDAALAKGIEKRAQRHGFLAADRVCVAAVEFVKRHLALARFKFGYVVEKLLRG